PRVFSRGQAIGVGLTFTRIRATATSTQMLTGLRPSGDDGPRTQAAPNGSGMRVCTAVLVALLSACGVRPERSILDEFFAASRLRDKTALAKFSTVTFEPLEQGIVVDYK